MILSCFFIAKESCGATTASLLLLICILSLLFCYNNVFHCLYCYCIVYNVVLTCFFLGGGGVTRLKTRASRAGVFVRLRNIVKSLALLAESPIDVRKQPNKFKVTFTSFRRYLGWGLRTTICGCWSRTQRPLNLRCGGNAHSATCCLSCARPGSPLTGVCELGHAWKLNTLLYYYY